MEMVAPFFKVWVTVAGGLDLFDLSCCAFDPVVTNKAQAITENANIFFMSVYFDP